MEETTKPGQSLVANDKDGGNGSLSVRNNASLLVLLVLGAVDVEDVVFAL
jgi:hypothetical protein